MSFHLVREYGDLGNPLTACRAELDAAEAFDAAVVTSDVLSVEFCSKYGDSVASAICGDGDDGGKQARYVNPANPCENGCIAFTTSFVRPTK